MSIDFNLWGPEVDDKIDFPLIKQQAAANSLAVLEAWLPGGKVSRGEYQCASIYGGVGDSCSTNLSTGVGSDFATGQTWGDLIDLIAQSEDCAPHEAARKLKEFIGGGSFPVKAMPVIPRQSAEDRYAFGKALAAGMWIEADFIIPADHPYLLRKGITPSAGIKYHPQTQTLLIPLQDENGVQWNAQRIWPDGDKKGVHCGKITGNYHVIMPPEGKSDIIYIAEGYATSQTVAMITKKMCVMALSAGNLAPVAEKIAKKYPTSKIIIAADNDCETEGNPGIRAANEAVKRIGRGCVIAPPGDKKADWNDYANEHGAKLCHDLLFSVPPKKLFIDIADLAETETVWLIEDLLAVENLSMVFGPSGSGKSFLALDWAFHIAAGKDWNGKKVTKGGVLYFCGEGKSGIIKRRCAWEKHHNLKLSRSTFKMSESTIEFTPEGIEAVLCELREYAEQGFYPVYIIIDTLARSMPAGGDENSVKDMMLFLSMCARLQEEFQAHVQPVHHTGHTENRRARGSSAIRAALDAEICLLPDDKMFGKIEWTKTKDYDAPTPISYKLEKVSYGDSKNQSSLVMVCNLDFVPEPQTAVSKDFYDWLKDCADNLGTWPTLHAPTARDMFLMQEGITKSHWKRGLDSLLAANTITATKRGVAYDVITFRLPQSEYEDLQEQITLDMFASLVAAKRNQ